MNNYWNNYGITKERPKIMKKHQKDLSQHVVKTLTTLSVLYAQILTEHTHDPTVIKKIEDTLTQLSEESLNIGFKKGMDAGYSIGHGFGIRKQPFHNGKRIKAFKQRLHL